MQCFLATIMNFYGSLRNGNAQGNEQMFKFTQHGQKRYELN
jgi:hypothetical protein